MITKKSLGTAIKTIRKIKDITQEDFSAVSSRTYISTIERGIYSPTIDKVNDISKVLNIHPITLLTLSYLIDRKESNPAEIIAKVLKELSDLLEIKK